MPLTNDENMQVTYIPVKEIYIDHEFNTRTKISPIDVIDLAKSIRDQGLQQPIIVRPSKDHHTTVPAEYKYAVVAGFRRLTACKVAEIENIPCIIREGLTDFNARTINVIENLKRSNLNMLEEANCIKHWKDEGYGREAIAEELGMSPGWVQIREMILELPKEIQDEVAKGVFNAVNIRELNTLKKDPDQQLLAARKLKEAKQKGENKTADQVLKKPPKATVKKQRVVSEIKEIMKLYSDTFGFNLTTQILAWCVGEIDNSQLYYAMDANAKKQGIDFTIPQMTL